MIWDMQFGFFFVYYVWMYQQYIDKFYDLYSLGKFKILIDLKKFVGVYFVVDVVEYF